jgi:hypothetical protein
VYLRLNADLTVTNSVILKYQQNPKVLLSMTEHNSTVGELRRGEYITLSEKQRLWYALDTLWRIGSEDEARRLAVKLEGEHALLANGTETPDRVQLTKSYVDPNPTAPRGFDIRFDWKCDGQYGAITHFAELVLTD